MIRLNLLAEIQEQEEARRNNPVRIAMVSGGFLVFLMLLWASQIFISTMVASTDKRNYQNELDSLAKRYSIVTMMKTNTQACEARWNALNELARNRLLYGTLLNGLQNSMLEQVQLTRFNVKQSYAYFEGAKAKVIDGVQEKAKPASSTEKIVCLITAKETTSSTTDSSVTAFKNRLEKCEYFKFLNQPMQVRLVNLGAPDKGPDRNTFTLFTLEGTYPEIKR